MDETTVLKRTRSSKMYEEDIHELPSAKIKKEAVKETIHYSSPIRYSARAASDFQALEEIANLHSKSPQEKINTLGRIIPIILKKDILDEGTIFAIMIALADITYNDANYKYCPDFNRIVCQLLLKTLSIRGLSEDTVLKITDALECITSDAPETKYFLLDNKINHLLEAALKQAKKDDLITSNQIRSFLMIALLVNDKIPDALLSVSDLKLPRFRDAIHMSCGNFQSILDVAFFKKKEAARLFHETDGITKEQFEKAIVSCNILAAFMVIKNALKHQWM